MKRYRIIIACIACLLLAGAVLGIRFLARQFPKDSVLHEIQTQMPAGMRFHADKSSLVFLPHPGLSLKDVSISDHSGPVFTARELRILISFSALLKRSIGISEIIVRQPLLLVTLDSTAPKIAEPAPPLPQPVRPTLSPPSNPLLDTKHRSLRELEPPVQPMLPAFLEESIQIPELLRGVTITLYGGSVRVARQHNKLFSMEGLEGSFTIPGQTAGAAQLEAGNLELRLGTESIMIHGLRVNVENSLDPTKATRLSMRCYPQLPGPLQATSIQLETRLYPETGDLSLIQGIVRMQGEIDASPRTLPYTLSAPFSFTHTGMLSFNGLSIQAGTDSLLVNANLEPFAANPQIQGQLRIEKLSLPYWFSFARSLPRGIPSLLNSIRGTALFTLNRQSLTVQDMEMHAAGVKFYGDAGIKDWNLPVFQLNARTNRLNLTALLNMASSAPRENYERSFPWHGDSEKMLDFDIRLGADAAVLGKQDLYNLTARCAPENKTLSLFLNVENLYEGTASAQATFADPILLELNARDMKLDSQTLSGRLAAQARLSFPMPESDSSAEQILKSLQGSLQITLDDATIPLSGKAAPRGKTNTAPAVSRKKTLNIEQLELAGDFSPAPAALHSLTYTGQWKGRLKQGALTAACTFQGAMDFSPENGMPIRGKALAAKLQAQIPPELSALPGTEEFLSSAIVSFDREKNTMNLEQGEFSFAAGQGFFESVVDTALPRMSGTLNVHSGAPHATLVRLGILAPDSPLPCSQLQAKTSFACEPQKFTLEILSAVLDQSRVQGAVQSLNNVWDFMLTVDSINFDRYLNAGQPKTGLTLKKGAQSFQNARLPQITGTVLLRNARIFKTEHYNMHIPVTAQDSRIRMSPVTADLYGGHSKGSLTINLGSQATFQGDYTANALNMATLSKTRGQSTLVSGTGQLQFSAQSQIFIDTPLSTLNGNWNLLIDKGSVQSKTVSLPMSFESVTASGTITNGVLRNNNLLVSSDSMNAKGHGWLNLVNETLDYTMVMTFYRLGTVPLRIYGTLDDPKTSIKEFQAVTKTLENMGNGVLDLSTTILETPFQILNSLKKKVIP